MLSSVSSQSTGFKPLNYANSVAMTKMLKPYILHEREKVARQWKEEESLYAEQERLEEEQVFCQA